MSTGTRSRLGRLPSTPRTAGPRDGCSGRSGPTFSPRSPSSGPNTRAARAASASCGSTEQKPMSFSGCRHVGRHVLVGHQHADMPGPESRGRRRGPRAPWRPSARRDRRRSRGRVAGGDLRVPDEGLGDVRRPLPDVRVHVNDHECRARHRRHGQAVLHSMACCTHARGPVLVVDGRAGTRPSAAPRGCRSRASPCRSPAAPPPRPSPPEW